MPECTHITAVIEQYYALQHWSDSNRFTTYQLNAENHLIMYKRIVTSMLKNSQKSHRKIYKYYVYKDPYLTKWVNLIPSFFGKNSQILSLIRDPRSIINSYIRIQNNKNKKSNAWLKIINYFNKNKKVKDLTNEIITYFNALSIIEKKINICFVSYEKLCAQQQKEIHKINKFLGFKISNKKNWRMLFPFDTEDSTYSNNYGKEIINIPTLKNNFLSLREENYVKNRFSSYNKVYGWW